MEEDSMNWNVGITQGVGDSSSILVEVEEHGSLPISSSIHTQNPTYVPPLPKKSKNTFNNQSVV